MITSEQRLMQLYEATKALVSELSLPALLRKFVEIAASLTDARYGALGVIDPSGRELQEFIAWGVDPETEALIGDPPRGRGVLGALIEEARPLRLHDISEDPRSVGFPPGHPSMRTFLGVPIMLRGVAYGNLYLAEKEDGLYFTEEDEEVVSLLAGQVAVAIENARLYESATRWSRQLESLNEVGNALTEEIELGRMLELIAGRLHELIQARLVTITLPTPDRELRVEAAAGEHAAEFVGTLLGRTTSKSGRALERKRTERVDALLDDPEVDHDVARALGVLSGLYVPLIVHDEAIGVIAVHDKAGPDPRFSDEDCRLAEAFAARAAVAVDLSRRVVRDTFRQVLAAQELERRRLALELHDETGQALTSVLLGLRAVEDAKPDDRLHESVEALRELIVGTLQDVRRLAVELRPKVLDDFGLVAAVERLTAGLSEQTGITVDLAAQLGRDRLPSELETAFYRIVQEALTNVVKHARAQRVSILLTRTSGSVAAVIEDDGRGFSPEDVGAGGLGLVGMRERIALLSGRLEIESAEGAGTTLKVEVPLL